MKFEPMIKAQINNFKNEYGYEKNSDSEVFENFVNFTIIKSHQPDAFNAENDLADLVCVDGENDTGIDGIAVKINGIFITSKEDINDIIKTQRRLSIEFIFIQSKYKDKFDSGEYGKYIDGVSDFLHPVQVEPHNSKIQYWLDIKNYLLDNDIISAWYDLPQIRLYYVVMGQWTGNEHIVAKTNRFKKDIEKIDTYGQIYERYIDSEALLRISEENDNNFNTVLNVLDILPLTEVIDVDNSLMVMCSAYEIIKMLQSSDNHLRKSLFSDNVRDYQGDTSINEDIMKTIEKDPKKFILMNNGITIVCSKALSSNRKVIIDNPQVVNGCQTCNVLYEAYKRDISLNDVVLIAKVISTTKTEITNQIVKGTNRQNIVLDEAFEITRDFHKNLESFILSMPSDEGFSKIYYERRSKQYTNNPTIKQSQKINFRTLIQSSVSVLLKLPHYGYRHEARLLDEFKNILFVDNQSLLPYYTVPYFMNILDEYYRANNQFKWCLTFKHQILYVYSVMCGGFPPNINNNTAIDAYCKALLESLTDRSKIKKNINQAIELYSQIVNKWIEQKGSSYKHGIKDSSEFTEFLSKELSLHTDNNHEKSEIAEKVYRGTVVREMIDKNSKFCGFISRMPEDIFYHSTTNINIAYGTLYAKDVLYTLIIKGDGRKHAKIIQVL